MCKRLRSQLQAFQDFFVPFKELDGIPSVLLLGEIMHGGFLNVRDCMLNATGKPVLRKRPAMLRGVDCGLRRLHHARTFERGDFHGFAAELAGKLPGVDFVAPLPDKIHHIDRKDDGDPEFGKLGR